MMLNFNAIFVDTNVLVRATIESAPRHQEARIALNTLHAANIRIWISRQVLREYWSTVTRTQTFMQPLPHTDALSALQSFQRQFWIADDNLAVTQSLHVLLEHIPISGKQVHDANIVTTMLANQIQRLLTFNMADFSRFAQYVTLLPIETLAPPNNAP
jgi:predicted nucleic acid-binding protein